MIIITMQPSTRVGSWEENVEHKIIIPYITIKTINTANLETPGRRTPGPFTGRSMSSIGESGLLRNGGRSGSLDIEIIMNSQELLISLIMIIIITIIIIIIMLIIYLTLQGWSLFKLSSNFIITTIIIIVIIIMIIIIMIMLIIYLTLRGCSSFPQVHLSAKSEFFPQLLFAAPNIINHNKPWYNESTHYGYWSLIMWIDPCPLFYTVLIVIIIMS